MKEFLKCHADKTPVSFHMPGHKGSRLYKRFGYTEFLENFMDWDITEIEGADNLFNAEGIICEVQKKYADLYGVKNSWLLINGSSSGLLAAIMACVSVGGKMIMARNCHKSVFNAARLLGTSVVYAYPEILGFNNKIQNKCKNEKSYFDCIAGSITKDEIRACIEANRDAEAVVITSPNYYGICSDIKAIAEVVHEAGMKLIVDQAHGAHLKFFADVYGCDEEYISDEIKNPLKFPLPGEMQGADIVVCSTHKTLASMTQTAILNLCTENIKAIDIEDKLQLAESTSPSYILMSSLDINCDLMENYGKKLISEWYENLSWFYGKVEKIKELNIMSLPMLDKTKINLDFGVSGKTLYDYLISCNIYPELYTGNMVMLMTGIGNCRQDYERLSDALINFNPDIADKERSDCLGEAEDALGGKGSRLAFNSDAEKFDLEKIDFKTKRDSFTIPDYNEGEWVRPDESLNRISASAIVPYPPGIPLICPGELITAEKIEELKKMIKIGWKITGFDEFNRIRAVKKHIL